MLNFNNEIIFNNAIKNIKWHTTLHNIDLVRDRYFYYRNIKVYIFIFPLSKIINFCARTTFEEVNKIHDFFCVKYNILKEFRKEIKIDNSTFSLNRREGGIDLYSFHDFLQNKFGDNRNVIKIKKLSLFPEIFPALRIKLNDGTINISSNGKLVILGGVSKIIILDLLYFITDELERFKLYTNELERFELC